MEIKLQLLQDSYNSNPTDELSIMFIDDNDEVDIQLTDSDRRVSVSKEDLKKILSIL